MHFKWRTGTKEIETNRKHTRIIQILQHVSTSILQMLERVELTSWWSKRETGGLGRGEGFLFPPVTLGPSGQHTT